MTNKIDFSGAIFMYKKGRTGSIFTIPHRENF